jgi:flagellar biosynthetic protein FliR
MGLAAQVLLAAARIAGSSIESLAGLTFGLPAESENLEDGSAFSKLYWWTTVAVFIATGGATAMVGGIIESFRVWPPGASSFGRDTLDFFTAALRNCFDFGLRAALPGMAALLVASAVLGIAQRNCPQLGGIQVGLGLKAIAGLLVTSLLLLSTPWIVSHGFEESWGQLQELFTACEASP